MKTVKLICLLCIATLLSCSSGDDGNDTTTPDTSYYKITVDGTVYENDELTSALGTFVEFTTEDTGDNLASTVLQVYDNEIFITIQAQEINGTTQPLSNEQDSYDSFILISLNDIGYYSDSGTVTIVQNNQYQVENSAGLTETLMEFSGVFINANDESDVKNISGKAFVKRLY